jgi:HAD superfamily hydrolase (TIGR01484 family)
MNDLPKKIDAVAFDLDSTLAESKSPVTEEMGAKLAKLMERMPVAVVSGGSWKQFTKQLLSALPKDARLDHLYLFPVSGGMCFKHDGKVFRALYDHSLLPREKKAIMKALTSAMEETGFVQPPEKVWGERVEDRDAQISFSALGQEAPPEEKKIWDPDKKKRTPLYKALSEKLPRGFIARMNAGTTIDITRAEASKAFAVREFSRLSGVPINTMLYVGDALFPGGNDEIVKQTGVATRQVLAPRDTASLLDELAVSRERGLRESLSKTFHGDLTDDMTERDKYAKDTSLFTKTPSLVAYPKDARDVVALVKAVRLEKERGHDISLTARSAGTDMSGGPLTNSVVAVFTKYMNRISEVTKEQTGGHAVVEPGCYYRDFEKETLKKNLLLPSYPASRSIAALGGIINNNSGGERTLQYGKTERYVEELEVVLSDGTKTVFKALTPAELAGKQSQRDFEGEVYRKMGALISSNRSLIEGKKPRVSKNSAGYALWDVYDAKRGTFNLAKLIVGAQGTLALTTKAKLHLVTPEEHRAMLVVFLSDLTKLPEIVRRVLSHTPESFESYDDHTLSLAVKFLPQMLSQMGLLRATRLGFAFLPEVGLVMTRGVPKLVLMAEFARSSSESALLAAKEAEDALHDLKLPTRIAKNEEAAEKYWIVRRESFALLRKNLHGYYAAPFIDDFVVPPDTYPRFLPELNALLAQYDLIYTIAGHVGNGNFHIIPLMDLKDPRTKKVVLELAPKVYALVLKYGGTTTGEHNDGIIRTPYLTQQFGPEMVKLFEETKKIFDPLNIFNPGKKVHGTFADIERDMLKE